MLDRSKLLALTEALETHVQSCPAIFGDDVSTEVIAMVAMNTLLLDVDGESVELIVRSLTPAPDVQNAPVVRHIATAPNP